jgi:hypothetical protein
VNDVAWVAAVDAALSANTGYIGHAVDRSAINSFGGVKKRIKRGHTATTTLQVGPGVDTFPGLWAANDSTGA